MPQPRLFGPTLSEVFRRGGGANLSRGRGRRAQLEQVAAGGGEVDQDRLNALNADIADIERRSARNKRGISARSQERLDDLRARRDAILSGQERAAAEVARRNRSNARRKATRTAQRAANPAPKKTAKKVANPAPKKTAKKAAETTKKATTKTTKKATGTTSSRAPRKKAT